MLQKIFTTFITICDVLAINNRRRDRPETENTMKCSKILCSGGEEKLW